MNKFDVFTNKFSHDIYKQKYSMDGQEEWADTCRRVVNSVCGQLLDTKEKEKIYKYMLERKFIPGGRYLYSAGRPFHQVNNCFVFRAEDSREGWADIMQKSTAALMSGGGIGIDYSKLRSEGAKISRTGGSSTGSIALMSMVNESGRYIMQGGQRRCLPAETKVTMADGSKKEIRLISVGDYVSTRFGSRKVLGIVEQGTQPLIKVTTSKGSTISSPEHRWLGANSARSKTWIRTKNLSLNNKLYFHPTSSELTFNNEDLNYYYTVGYFIGDGCAYSSGRTHEVTFQFSNDWKDESQLKRISTIMEKLGSNPIVREGNGDCTELRCRSKELVSHFQKYKFPHESPNIGEISSKSQRAVAAVLAGWLDSDGYLNDDKWCISTGKEETASKICHLFNKLNILTSISKTNISYEVRICSYQRSVLFEYMGELSTKLKLAKFDKSTAEIPVEILKIETLPPENTFDIQVEEVEEFIADGFVSHNSAIWAGLNWSHGDMPKFLDLKNYSPEIKKIKDTDFNFPVPMELTNISVIYDTEFFIAIENETHAKHALAKQVWLKNCKQAFSTAEPGMSFNFRKDNESLRNACTELVSEDDSDKCNLGTVWFNRIKDKKELADVVKSATYFLLCGGIYSDTPTEKIKEVGTRNNRIGLGLGGLHEWLMMRGNDYEVVPELHKWLSIYETESDSAAFIGAKQLNVAVPKGIRAIAPTGTIGILSETTTSAEPLFCKAYKRRYFKEGKWLAQYVVDGTVKRLLDKGIKLEEIKDSFDLTFKQRVKFQADVQNYVDMAISSTCNMPAWGSETNNENTVEKNADTLLKYAKRLRGFTVYPDGCRSGQPLNRVDLKEALNSEGQVFEENELECVGGVCGI